MPTTLKELTEMIAARDSISFNEAAEAVQECQEEMNEAFMSGSLDAAEDALRYCLGLEPDYLMLFIN